MAIELASANYQLDPHGASDLQVDRLSRIVWEQYELLRAIQEDLVMIKGILDDHETRLIALEP